jgi:N-acetylglucosamine-6-phosphate deacetylase
MKGRSVFTGKPVEVRWDGVRLDRVEEICEDTDLPWVSPGFLDIQVNGFLGSEYNLPDFNVAHAVAITGYLAKSGTTRHVPTICTSPADVIIRNVKILAELRENDKDLFYAIPGLHIEGPFISGEDGPRGAHDRFYVRDPDWGEFREWQAAAKGLIKMVTLAPERKGAIRFIEKLVAEGIVPAIGHCAADPETIRRAVDAGAKFSTHLGNGSAVMIPRLKNWIWEQLAADELCAGVISDGFHLPESVLKVFYRAKGSDRIVLVSDVSLCGGYSPGLYKSGNIDVEVFPDGHLGLPGTAILAGAAHLLNWDIPVFKRALGISLGEVIRLCTQNPAKLLNIETAMLEPGDPADLTFFRFPPGKTLEIEAVYRRGRKVYPAEN